MRGRHTPDPNSLSTERMTDKQKKWLKSTVRWGVAFAGVYYVLSNIAFRDQVILLDPATHRPTPVQVLNNAKDTDREFLVTESLTTGRPMTHVVPRDVVWTRPDRVSVGVFEHPAGQGALRKAKVLALKP